jgi:hypothetical protein
MTESLAASTITMEFALPIGTYTFTGVEAAAGVAM